MTKFYGDIELHNNITELSKKSRIQRIKEVREQEKLLALERSQDFRKYVDERKQIKYEKKVQLKKQQLIQEKLDKMKELEYCLVKTGEAHRNAKDEVKVFQKRLQSKERKYHEDEEKLQQRHQYALKVMKEEREIGEKETAHILHLKTLREQSRKEEREDAHYYAEHRAVREEVGRQVHVRKYQRALTPRSAERVHERFPTEINPTVVRHTMSDTNIVSNNATIQERVTLRKSWRAIMDELRRKRVMKEREKEAIQTHRQNRGARFLEEELQLLTLVDKSRHRIKETAQVEVEEEAEEVRGDATRDEFERIFMSTMAVKRRPTATASASSPSPQRQTAFSTIPSTLYLSNKPPPPSMPDDFSVTSNSEDSLQSSGSWRLPLRQQSGKREVESKASTNVKASAGGASAPLPRLPPPLPLAPPAYEMSERDQRASIDRSPSTDHDAQEEEEEEEEEEEVVVQANQRHQEQISDLQQHREEKKEEWKEEKKEVLRREEEESSSEDSDQDESSDDNDDEEEAEEMKEEFKKPFPAQTIPSRETALAEARELSRQRQELEQRERMKFQREREREREKTMRDWSRAEVNTTSSLLQEQWKQRNEEALIATHPQRQQPGPILPPPLPMTSRENIQTTSYMPAPRPISIPMHPRFEEVVTSQPLPIQEPPQLPTLRGLRVPAEPLMSADHVERRTHQNSSTTAIATSTAFTATNTLNTFTGSSTVQRKESVSPVVSLPLPPSLPSNKIQTTKKEESFLSMTSATSTRSSSTKSSSSSSSSPSISLASSMSETQSKGFAEQLTSHILQHSLNQAVEVERDESRHMMTSTSISTASLDRSESTISETGIEVEIAPQTAPRQLNLNMTGSDYHSSSRGESSSSSSSHSTQSSPSSTPSSSNVSRSSSSSSSRERRDQFYVAATNTATVTAPAGTSFTSSPSSQSSNSSSQPILLLRQPLHSTSSTSSTPSSTSYSSHGLPPLPSPLEKPQHFSMTQLLQHDQTVNEIQREIVEMRQRLLSAVSYPSAIPAPAMSTMLSPSTPSFALSSSASSPPPLSPKSDDVSTNTSDISNILDSRREHESSRLTSSKKVGGEERESLSTGSLNSKDLLSLRTSSSSSASVSRYARTSMTSQSQGKTVTSLQRELTATPTDSTASSHSSDSLAQWMTSSKQPKERRDVNTTLLTSDEEEGEEEEERFRQQKKQFQQKLQEKRNYLLTSSLNLATTTSTTTTTILRQSTARVVGRSSANANDRSLSSGSLLQSALDVTLSSEDDDVSSVGEEKRKLILSNATSTSMSPKTPSLSQEYLQATSATLSSRSQTHLLATPSTPSSSSSISSSRLLAMRSKIASDALSEDSLSI
eukprot:gene5363-5750_t